MTPRQGQALSREPDGRSSSRSKKAGVRVIVVGSPGCVDADTFRKHDPNAAMMYNKTLAEERDIAREVAQAEGVAVCRRHHAR